MLKQAKAKAKAESGAGAASHAGAGDLPKAVLESSRQIWLAGLGAFSKAQAEGMKVFESLVQQGEVLEKRVRPLAESIGAQVVGELDVTNDDQIAAVFARIKELWGGLDMMVHAIAFADREAYYGDPDFDHVRSSPPGRTGPVYCRGASTPPAQDSPFARSRGGHRPLTAPAGRADVR